MLSHFNIIMEVSCYSSSLESIISYSCSDGTTKVNVLYLDLGYHCGVIGIVSERLGVLSAFRGSIASRSLLIANYHLEIFLLVGITVDF